MNTIAGKIPPEKRSPVFFTDISPPAPDNFIEEVLHGNGWDYFDAFPSGWEDSFGTERGRPITTSEYWLEVNRASNGMSNWGDPCATYPTDWALIAMARSNMKPDVYVSMDPEGGARSVFNGVQTYKYSGKGDIDDRSTWVETNKGRLTLQIT